MERLELLDPHHRPSKYGGIISDNIASNNNNNCFLDVENGVMSQDETSISISGKMTEIVQYFPNHNNQKRKMFHLQLDSKETFHCCHSSSGGRAKKIGTSCETSWMLNFKI